MLLSATLHNERQQRFNELQDRTENLKQAYRMIAIMLVIDVAIFVITILGISGVFPPSAAGYIVGSCNLALFSLYYFVQYRGYKIYNLSFSLDEKLQMVTILVIQVLGISEVIPFPIFGMMTLSFCLLSPINQCGTLARDERNREPLRWLAYLLPISIGIINFLGGIDVLANKEILGALTLSLGGLFLFAALRTGDSLKEHLSTFVYLIVMAALTYVPSITPTQLGIAGVAGLFVIQANKHLLFLAERA